MNQYLYPNEDAVALERLRALERIEDAHTQEELDAVGIGTGWCCLEIGAGAGSIAYWLAECVGEEGRVVATDLEPRLLDPARCEVWRHDIVADALPPVRFDLVHLRHILVHVPREEHPGVLSRIRQALKPGGVLVAEESDFSTWRVEDGVPEPLRSHGERGIGEILAAYTRRGMNVHLGRRLVSLAQGAGLQVTRTTRRARVVAGGSDEARFHQVSFRQLASTLSDAPPEAADALARLVESLDDPRLSYTTRTTVAVSATRV